MVNCAIQNCGNTSAKITKDKDGITFHRFPRDSDRRRQWEVSVNREETWSATESSVICSQHFATQDFYLTESGLRRLRCNAVPSNNISICQPSTPTVSNTPIVDIKSTDTEEVVQLKLKVRRLEAIAENRKRRLVLMWQDTKRVKRKLVNLESIIKHLIADAQVKQHSNNGHKANRY